MPHGKASRVVHHCPGASGPVSGYPGNCRHSTNPEKYGCITHENYCKPHDWIWTKGKSCILCDRAESHGLRTIKAPKDDDDDDDDEDNNKPKKEEKKPRRNTRASTVLKMERRNQGKGKQTKKQKAASEKKKPAGKTAAFVYHRCPTCLNVCDEGFTAGGIVSPRSTIFNTGLSSGMLQLTLSKKQWSEVFTQANVVVV